MWKAFEKKAVVILKYLIFAQLNGLVRPRNANENANDTRAIYRYLNRLVFT